MANALYMTTLDGNVGHRDLRPAWKLRKEIMFQLLFWDYVCVADSQFLTNSNFSDLLLMGDEIDNGLKMRCTEGQFCLYDLDLLSKNGLLRCVRRDETTLEDVRSGFEKRFGEDRWILSKENTVRLSKRICKYESYKLDHVAGAFKANLHEAFEKSRCLEAVGNPALKEQVEGYINGERVNFDDLERILSGAYHEDSISEAARDMLYNLVKSCYIPNVPKALNMHFLAESDFLPIWMDPRVDTAPQDAYQSLHDTRMNYCCMFDSRIVNILPIKTFIDIRNKLNIRYQADDREKLLRFLLADLPIADVHEREDAIELFNTYTSELNRHVWGELKNIYNSMTANGFRADTEKSYTLIKNVASGAMVGAITAFVPCMVTANLSPETNAIIIGAMVGALEPIAEHIGRQISDGVIKTFHRRNDMDVRKYYREMEKLINSSRGDFIISANDASVGVI
ncbi:MAG: hypothetical protein LUG99_03365 [Lachnospiraceae bacterium]|nr:hypothetical protein [Lachnospiraceae bacterium]